MIESGRESAETARRLVIGIGEYAASDDPRTRIITHALGSCVGICVWDPAARTAGLLHVLLPDSRINLERAANQPAAFADTGLPLLLEAVSQIGARKARLVVKIAGGADVMGRLGGEANVGKRNVLAVRGILWRLGIFTAAEDVGGTEPRNLSIDVATGIVRVSSARRQTTEL